MDQVPEPVKANGEKRGKSKAARYALTSFFSFASAFGTAYCFGAGHFALSAVVFFAASLVMTFVFTHQKRILFSFVPFVLGYLAVLLPGVDRVLALIALSAVLFFSATVSVLLIRRAEKFHVFLLSSALFFVVYSGILLLLLSGATGSVAAASGRLFEKSKYLIGEMIRISAQNGISTENIDVDALSVAATALVPATVMILSMVSSLLFTLFFGFATKASGTRDLLMPGEFTVPRPFAVIYIIIAFMSFLTGSVSDSWSCVILNLNYVLMAIFVVVGIRSLSRSAKRRRTGGRLITVVIIAAAAAVFFGGSIASVAISIVLPVLSYIGAFRSLRPAVDKGSERQ